MLKFNPRRVLALRGVTQPLTYLMKNGFTRGIANNLLNNNNSSIKEQYIERLCSLLFCTPNDLYDWLPNAQMPLSQDHPLQSLKRDKYISPTEYMKEMPLEKLNEIFTRT